MFWLFIYKNTFLLFFSYSIQLENLIAITKRLLLYEYD